MLDDLAELNQTRTRASSAIPRSPRASPSTSWPTACRRRVPELTDLSERAAPHSRAVRPRRRASPARSRPTACWPAGWPSAACASSSSSTAAGTSTPTCRSRSPASAATPTSRAPRLLQDLEAARPARRHAGRLGRRVRPHRLLPGQADRATTTAATTTRAASRSGWPAAASSPASRYGETDDFSYNVVKRSGPRPRPARDDPALPGHRPHPADLQVPGPPLPPDRCAWESGQERARVAASRPPASQSPRFSSVKVFSFLKPRRILSRRFHKYGNVFSEVFWVSKL